MRFGKYLFRNILRDEAILPPYKGSTFRGAFGVALKRVVCAVRRDDCVACLLASRCIYARTFELVQNEPDRKMRLAAPPHPYVIQPPLSRATHFNTGDTFDFTLLLFGEANDFLPYFVYAFETMGEIGIGKKIGNRRSAFVLTSVEQDGVNIYTGETKRLLPALEKTLSLVPHSEDPQEGTLTINFLTPLRLKFDNHLQAQLPFHLLVRAALRRISSLFAYYGAGEPALDYRGMVKRAEAITVERADLRWYDWERYSNRQDQAMLMGGMAGSITYRGAIGEYLPLLELARELHIGKQTSFGLGMFDFTWGTCAGSHARGPVRIPRSEEPLL
ncbi:MAG: CRISPR system precrRNA processing endoribonuclease RAMP protein Cas6 [Syntrophales bacterium]|nr:CRISPR system precrRNA processing endoribonuclease RAMP protein Cas6 [Syntrophales bacterium]